MSLTWFYLTRMFQHHRYEVFALLMCIILIKGNQSVENSDYKNVWITANGVWNVLVCNFGIFIFFSQTFYRRTSVSI